uniref:Lrp/AsnC ligand binding domain-containing protein n=2 Tax=Serratia TaxID=613 RepID=UPI003B6824F3
MVGGGGASFLNWCQSVMCRKHPVNFFREVRILPEVVECRLMVGDCDFLLRLVATDIDVYRQFQIKHLDRINAR